MPKCPFCYREAGTHTHDPILLPDGAPYKWSNATTLISEPDIAQREYKGTNQVREDDIMELQIELTQLEVDNGVTPLTVFSPINTSGKFQITGYHIKEMRDSVEKILVALSLTKADYFNYDEDGNHITHPNGDKIEWTDPITLATDLQKFQIKAIHIEDLRHYINMITLIWTTTGVTGKYSDVINFKDTSDFQFNNLLNLSNNSLGNSICVDTQYIYTCGKSEIVRKYNISDGSLVDSGGFVDYHYGIVADIDNIWTIKSNSSFNNLRISQMDKDLNIIDDSWYILISSMPTQYSFPMIAVDNENLYILYDELGFFYRAIIIQKSTKTVIFDSELVEAVRVGGIGIDNERLYWVNTDGISASLQATKKDSFDFFAITDEDISFSAFSPTVTIGGNNVYVLCPTAYPNGKLRVYRKSDLSFLYETFLYGAYSIIFAPYPTNFYCGSIFGASQYSQVL